MRGIAILLAGLLGGCAADPKPEPVSWAEMSPTERCMTLLQLSGNAYLNAGEKMAAYEKARNIGCMGQPQPQTVIVR